MSYQESMVQISSLAEAAGIRRALMDKGWEHWFGYFSTEKALKDLTIGNPLVTSDDDIDCREHIPAGTTFVMVGGDRYPYQMSFGRWHFLDAVEGLTMKNYYDHFEPLDEAQVEASWDEDPEAAQREYDAWSAYLDYCRCCGREQNAWWQDQVAFGSQNVMGGGSAAYLDLAI